MNDSDVRTTSVISSAAIQITYAPAEPTSERITSPMISPSTPPARCPPKTCVSPSTRCTSAQPSSMNTTTDDTRVAQLCESRTPSSCKVASASSIGSHAAPRPNAETKNAATDSPTGPIQFSPPRASYENSESPKSTVDANRTIPKTSWRRPPGACESPDEDSWVKVGFVAFERTGTGP